jgi:hypothetical protein
MGAKIWWQWLKYPHLLWAKFWWKKYSMGLQQEELIRIDDHIQGSNIWNVAWCNHRLIQKNSFWEVRNDQSA